MKHLGDITKINGAEIEPVDCITGGSPCQDLSVAGKRAGLAGERSGLFMEQMRIVKEMRAADVQRGRTGIACRPRYMVWENVPGAFSSGSPKGADFAAVLEEIVKVCEKEAPAVPVPEKGWPTAGCLYDEVGGWSIAWRVHDARFWGVPQRRKRIALVADFGGLSAPEILFERKGLRGDFAESREAGEGVAGDAKGSIDAASYTLRIRGGCEGGKGPLVQRELSGTLGCNQDQTLFCLNGQGGSEYQISVEECGCLTAATNSSGNNKAVVFNIGSYHSNAWKSDNPNSGVYETDFAKTLDAITCGAPTCNQGGTVVVDQGGGKSGANCFFDESPTLTCTHGGEPVVCSECLVCDARGNGDGKVAPTLVGNHQDRVTDFTVLACGNGQMGGIAMAEISNTLDCMHDQQIVLCAGVDCRNGRETEELYPTLQAKENGGQSLNYSGALRCGLYVRRLTPLECERLQGFPDGWTDIGDWVDSKGKKHKAADSPRYKALGNSIALPFWKYLCKRISAQYERDATLGSLFDGIGGFPLCWERVNGKGSARWASEIEEFPIAVTKARFGGE